MGVDVSAEMIRIARSRSPQLEFRVDAMASFLRARPGSVGNALFWYSVIHTAPEELAALLATTFTAVRPGGHVLLGFQSMADPAAATEPYDHRVAAAYRYSLAEVHRRLRDAGFGVLHLGLQAPGPGERVHAGYALARKPPPD
jgi:SAM-dependent methyltransferase